ncbi:MAG: hypothetical protein ACUVQZ_00345 [Candidatus Caldatribacteriaceae bacterium]
MDVKRTFKGKARGDILYFQLLHPLERIVYNVNTLCNQIAEKILWEKLRLTIIEDQKQGLRKNYSITQLSLREIKNITLEVLNRPEICKEIETASVFRCLVCGQKLGKWYLTINDRRVEKTKGDKKISEEKAVFKGAIPSPVEDNEEYPYVLRGAVNYWEATAELVNHLFQNHGKEIGQNFLGEKEYSQKELLEAIVNLVVKNMEKLLKEQLLTYERMEQMGEFPSKIIRLERKMIRRKKIITAGRIQRAYAEKKDIQIVLQDLELFNDGYYDIEIVYRDAPTDEDTYIYKEKAVKPADSDRIYQERKVWKDIFPRFSRWDNFQEMLKNSEKNTPVKISCKKCKEVTDSSFQSLEEFIEHCVIHHPDIPFTKRNIHKLLMECTSLSWLALLRKKTCKDFFAYLGPHYVDMLPPMGQKSPLRYGVLQQDRNRIYESYTRSLKQYQKYFSERRTRH